MKRLYFLFTLSTLASVYPIGAMSGLYSRQLSPYARQAARSLIASPSINTAQLKKQKLPIALIHNSQAVKLNMPQQQFVRTLHTKSAQQAEIPKFNTNHSEHEEEPSFTQRIISYAQQYKKVFATGAALGLGAYVWNRQEKLQQEAHDTIDNFTTADTEDVAKGLDYTINLMWINRNLDLSKRHASFFQFKEDEETRKQQYISTLCKWAVCNPKSIINLWFDSASVSPESVMQMQALITEQQKQYLGAPIALKDIRKLSYVKKHPKIFSDKTPVYFRSDLLRVIAGLETMEESNNSYFVYADFDVAPMSQEELFDAVTVTNLKTYGLVVATGALDSIENSFYILGSQKPNMHKALQLMLVDLNMQRAYNGLESKLYFKDYKKVDDPMRSLQQIVFQSYSCMFRYFYHLENMGILKIDHDEPYDFQLHGLKPFGLDCLVDHTTFESTEELHTPTKSVTCPLPSMNYD